MQLKSAVALQGIYTSDMAYTAVTLPKQMRFKPPKAADWFAEYAWLAFPESNMPSMQAREALNADLNGVGAKENRSGNAARPKSSLRSQRGASASKSVKFGELEEEKTGKAEGPAAASSAKKVRPRSAVKGKTGKIIPRGPASSSATKKNKQEASDEQPSRKRGTKIEPVEEEVKLSPEEQYEIEMKEA